MSTGLLYWILMLIWLLFGLYTGWPLGAHSITPLGGNLLLFIILVVLGWQVFGAPIKRT